MAEAGHVPDSPAVARKRGTPRIKAFYRIIQGL